MDFIINLLITETINCVEKRDYEKKEELIKRLTRHNQFKTRRIEKLSHYRYWSRYERFKARYEIALEYNDIKELKFILTNIKSYCENFSCGPRNHPKGVIESWKAVNDPEYLKIYELRIIIQGLLD